jgi:ribosomal protein S18 acetylase RimI-like enzyme
MVVRPLLPSDSESYVTLRREMLRDSPWAFAASETDDLGLDAASVASQLGRNGYAIIGALDESGLLVGAAGVIRPRHEKVGHRAYIWGVYVTPSCRGRGIGRRIMEHAIMTAKSWPGVTGAGLSVSEKSPEARGLYERLGFRAWGIEPGALRLDGVAYDEVHMVADF